MGIKNGEYLIGLFYILESLIAPMILGYNIWKNERIDQYFKWLFKFKEFQVFIPY